MSNAWLPECFHCNFPIVGTIPAQLRRGDTVKCPRCKRMLNWCDHCSDMDSRLKAIVRYKPNGLDRCPHCDHLMHNAVSPESQMIRKELSKDVDNPGTCMNIFGCRAGAMLWGTNVKVSQESCCACSLPGPSRTVRPYDELRREAKNCPVTLILVGEVDDTLRMVKCYTFREVIKNFTHRMAHPNKGLEYVPQADPHLISGLRPDYCLKWLVRDFGADVEIDGDGGDHNGDSHSVPDGRSSQTVLEQLKSMSEAAQTLPILNFDDVIQIFQKLIGTASEDELFDVLTEKAEDYREKLSFDGLLHSLLILFGDDTLQRQVVDLKLDKARTRFHAEIGFAPGEPPTSEPNCL